MDRSSASPTQGPSNWDLPVSAEVWRRILEGYALNVAGIHGVGHWARVLANGHRLAATEEADIQVVDLFAVFHDSRRLNDDWDPEHGLRGALLAEKLRPLLPPLTDAQMDQLLTACTHHTSLATHPDPTIQVCFDADRLDLARVGITPDQALLCKETARDPEVIAWATARSMRGWIPGAVREAWLGRR